MEEPEVLEDPVDEPRRTRKKKGASAINNPLLSASDLMDPLGEKRPPSRDELLAQRDLEMETILRQSDSLKG
jgi:hypothetical protein